MTIYRRQWNILLLSISVFIPRQLLAVEYKYRADDHASLGVTRGHTHDQGELMLSYRYMFMKMEGMRDRTDSINKEQVLEQFMVTPTYMDMQMHKRATTQNQLGIMVRMAVYPNRKIEFSI